MEGVRILEAAQWWFDEQTPEIRGPSPEMGQHTEEVLLELGVEWDERVRHEQAGAIL
jgi:formyl-CoA transferase